jgi:hypothetical protein
MYQMTRPACRAVDSSVSACLLLAAVHVPDDTTSLSSRRFICQCMSPARDPLTLRIKPSRGVCVCQSPRASWTHLRLQRRASREMWSWRILVSRFCRRSCDVCTHALHVWHRPTSTRSFLRATCTVRCGPVRRVPAAARGEVGASVRPGAAFLCRGSSRPPVQWGTGRWGMDGPGQGRRAQS